MRFLSETFLASVKRRSMVPISQNTFLDQDILDAGSEIMETELLPLVMSVREDYFLRFKNVPIIANLNHYAVPERAIGGALKDVWLLDSNGRRMSTVAKTEIHNLNPFETTGSLPRELILRGDEIMVVPTPSVSNVSLEVWYYCRPNQLTLTANCAKITAINTASGTTTLTVDTDLTASILVGTTLDVVAGSSPYLLRYLDVPVTAITSSSISFLAANVQDESGAVSLVVGDYLSPVKMSNVLMLPDEFHPVWAQATALYLIDSLGDLNKAQRAEQKLQMMKANVLKLIENRVESEPDVILNRHSITNSLGYAPASFVSS